MRIALTLVANSADVKVAGVDKRKERKKERARINGDWSLAEGFQ